jgi:signal transduction histidine kinase/CheY-like chemotaxis protein
MWRLGPERLDGRHVEQILRELAPAVEEPAALQRLAHLQQEPPSGGPLEFSLRDGRTITVYRAPIQSREGVRFGWGLYFQDITERLAQERVRARNLELEQRVAERTQELAERLRELRTTQEQLIVADRRTSVGTLAAGVAHEINNPLAYVTANIHFVLQELPGVKAAVMPGCAPEQRASLEGSWQEMARALVEAREGCSRVQHIVQSLKSFSRGEDDRCEPTELERPLEAAINMAANELRHRARLVRDYTEVPPVEANEVRLAQVFLNLLINAAHAIVPGAADQNEIRVSTRLGDDGQVRISITDTGSGMSPEVRSRLFTPFFTTKPVGVGTGLGLSVCQGIITRFGGTICVESELNRGSTFTVILPATASPVKRRAQPLPAPEREQRRGRVLVVDDDPFVGTALRRTLGREHDVTVALGAREALALILQGTRFDLILCDVMMPEMTGVDFFTELQRVQPPQAEVVTFFTGGAFTDATRAFLEQHPDRVLSKPLDADTLRERLFLQLGQGPSAQSAVA